MILFSQSMYELGANSSVIREIFEYGKKRSAQIGKENIFDFSLGNPSVPAPDVVNDAIRELLSKMDPTELHGYTSAVGDEKTRGCIADYLNKTYGTSFRAENFYITCGAAASLSIVFKALCEPGDEIILFAPFFPEYKVFAQSAGMKPTVVLCDGETLQIDLDAFEKALTENTKAINILLYAKCR